MAFGFGFNKQKVLSAAEKFVQQGKLQNAISEYEKILKHDAKDLTVMNTIGDLYSRLGEQDKAAECFKSVGDAYASQGFTVKAIAMYKKLSKLKSSMECVLRLAELYTQQGLFNDARAQYLQVAEDFLKTGQLDQAVRIFEKTLEMDPDNVAMRSKLAEVYVRLGKKEDAWKILSAAAESLRTKGQLAAADEILQRMLKLDPGNSYALVLRGLAALDSGDAPLAIELLSKVADLDTNPEGLRALFQAYLRSKRFEDADGLATKLATLHNDGAALAEYTDALLGAQKYREALDVYNQHADELLRNNPAKLSESLRGIIGHVRDDVQALELVLALFQKAGETTHLSELFELLAHAYVQCGNLEKARECYLKLMQMEPANAMHVKNYQQVLEKVDTPDAPRQITAEEGSVLVDELEATAPFIQQHYKDDEALAIQSALTDAELFISYNMAQKALAPLLNALPKAPRDLRLNQKLAALHSRAGRFTEAAVCCRTLESIYHDAGHSEEAARYGDLARQYEERGAGGIVAPPQEQTTFTPVEATPIDSVATEAAPEFEISAPVAESFGQGIEETDIAQPAPAATKGTTPTGVFFHASRAASDAEAVEDQPVQALEAQPTPEASVSASEELPVEVDLSSEWESELSVELPQQQAQGIETGVPEPPQVETTQNDLGISLAAAEQVPEAQPMPQSAPANLDDGIEEVRFYLGQGMTDQAEKALERLENVASGSPELAVLRLGVESAKQQMGTQVAGPEVAIEEAMPIEAAVVAAPEPAVAESAPQPWPQEPPHTAEPPVLQQLVSEIEDSLGDGFLPGAEPTKGPEVAPVEAAVAAAPVAEASVPDEHQFRSGTLDEFVSDLEASLGSDFAPEAPAAATEPPAAQIHPPVNQPPVPVAHVEVPLARAAAAAATSGSMIAPEATVAQHAVLSSADASVIGSSGTAVDLSDMFGELKHELEEGSGNTDEDPETHYNLGVAFREMGLLDEAIGEFQKVCQAAERGRAFSQVMQTYTWLAQCFLDKGIPEAAIRWYEKALKIPSIDQETRTALHYELASSFETAGNKAAALNNFLEVYGSNIDYRDVAERIKALRP